ncbi:MAG: 4-alpha-glucanotransferase [Polyangiaceae bacterium]
MGHDDPTRWPASPPSDPGAATQFEIAQLAAAEQHHAFLREARALGLAVVADAQIGIGHRDRHLYRSLLLPGYAMGAPPSRTNPEGQPWEYPVLDPRQWGDGGAARRFVKRRFEALFAEHDGVRIDHPHGWVCPWVYRTGTPDPVLAVQRGARLFESPDLPDHPDLAAFSRVRPDQIDRGKPRFDDAWVTELTPAQVDAFASAFDVILEVARGAGRGPGDLIVEVLSTCPRPLGSVLERHGLGRFRVTQKARVEVEDDVYRSDNARPADWIMTGNHDTPPLAALSASFVKSGESRRRAAFLARRLGTTADERAAIEGRLASDASALSEAMLAELFLGPARNALIFWVDLFGGTGVYNRPGVVSPDNWVMRVPPDFEAEYDRAIESGQAPSIARALALALHARGLDEGFEGAALARVLRGEAG